MQVQRENMKQELSLMPGAFQIRNHARQSSGAFGKTDGIGSNSPALRLPEGIAAAGVSRLKILPTE
jgi:hypothetical protein